MQKEDYLLLKEKEIKIGKFSVKTGAIWKLLKKITYQKKKK